MFVTTKSFKSSKKGQLALQPDHEMLDEKIESLLNKSYTMLVFLVLIDQIAIKLSQSIFGKSDFNKVI